MAILNIKRVPMNFDYPLHQVWKGYLNPYYESAIACGLCGMTGGTAQKPCLCCHGVGYLWHPEDKLKSLTWTPVEPPTGDGYQVWEGITEGSPISPVFATESEAKAWIATHYPNYL